jgi:hypothetical protein
MRLVELALLLSLINLATSQEIIGYDCTSLDLPITTVSLLANSNCVRKRPNITLSETTVQLIQVKNYDTAKFFFCDIEITVTISACGKWHVGRNIMLDSYKYSKQLSVDECKKIHDTNMYQDSAYEWVKVSLNDKRGTFSGYVVGDPGEGNCEGGKFITHFGKEHKNSLVHYFISVKTGQGIADVRLRDSSILIANTKCNYLDGNCFTHFGHTYWSIQVPNAMCDLNQAIVIYQGKVLKRVETTSEDNKITTFSLVDETESKQFLIEAEKEANVCGQKAYKTQHSKIFISESISGFNLQYTKNYSLKNIDMQIFHGIQLSLLSASIQEQVNDLYYQISYEKCLSDWQIAQNVLALSKLDSSNFGTLYLRKEGILSKIMGEIAFLFHCLPTRTKLRHTPNCYNDIPVFVDGKESFLTPLSRIIKKEGTEITCGGILQPAWRLNGTFFQKNFENYVKIPNPEEINILPANNFQFKAIKGIAQKGLYSEDEVNRYHESLVEPQTIEQRVNTLVRNIYVQNPSSEGISVIFKQKDFENIREFIFGHFFSGVIAKLSSLGNTVSIIIGLMFILRLVKAALNLFINTFAIYHVFGCSKSLLCCCFSQAINLFLQQENLEEIKKKKKEKNNENLEIYSRPTNRAPEILPLKAPKNKLNTIEDDYEEIDMRNDN